MSVETLSSCGSGLLDAAATSAIMEVTMFPPLPEDFAGGEASFTIPITFTFTRE
jgi:TonB family protein